MAAARTRGYAAPPVRFALVAVAVLLIVVLAGFVWRELASDHQERLRSARRALEHQVESAERHAGVTLLSVDSMLVATLRTLALEDPFEPMDHARAQDLLRRLAEQNFMVRDLVLLDRDGRWLNGLLGERVDELTAVPPRPAEPVPVGLHISGPYRMKPTGGWSIVASRPWLVDGKPMGFVAAEIPVDGFTDFYRAVSSDMRVHMFLFGHEGTLLAVDPPREPLMGTSFDDHLLFTTWLPQSESRTLAGSLFVGGEPGLVAYRSAPMWGLVIAATTDMDQILSEWDKLRRAYLILLGVVVVTILGFTTWLYGVLTRQHRVQRALEASRQEYAAQSTLLRATLENMTDALSVYDADGRLVICNERWADILQVPEPFQVPGSRFAELLRFQAARGDFGEVVPDDEIERRVQAALSGKAFQVERRLPSGRYMAIRRAPMPKGGFVTLYADITNIKTHEEEMRQARDVAEQASAAKSRFLAHMSHELRTPLNAILGFSQALQGAYFGDLSPRYRDYAGDIHAAGAHLLSLINDVLDLSKVEAGRFEVRCEDIPAEDLVKRVRMLAAGVLDHSKHALLHDIREGCPPLFADRRVAEQMIVNLIANAAKFSPAGASIHMTFARGAKGGVTAAVIDRGTGMTAEEIAIAFEPFAQARNAQVADGQRGTGLGLPLVKRFIELHGGSIEVDSRPGHGTTVRLHFPPEAAAVERQPRPATAAA